MSDLTSTATTAAAPPAPPVATRGGRGPRLSGMTWLIWRQHRAAYWTILAATVLCMALIAHLRTGLMDSLTAHGWPDSAPDKWAEAANAYKAEFFAVASGLGFIPIVLGVFLGAPLLAGDLENGTAKLVASQSVSPSRWLATKLGISALVVIVCTAALSVIFGWWWEPLKTNNLILGWSERSAFDITGPVPVALALLTLVGGVAIGMLLRRTLISMVVTFAFAVVVQVVWGFQRLNLGEVVTVTSDKGIDVPPQLPEGALKLDESYVSGSGETFGWGVCAKESISQEACVEKFDLVGWSVDYLPISQMSGMQWLGSSILFALTVVIAGFVFVWGRKRVV